MKYQEGKIGRIFVLSFAHDEDLLEPLINFIKEKNIRCGFVQLLGALQKGRVVCGPKKTKVPPDPLYKELKNAHELIAKCGTSSSMALPNAASSSVIERS